MDVAQEAAQFGPYAFLLVVILSTVAVVVREAAKYLVKINEASESRETQRYTERQQLNERMLSVVQSNTEAMNKVAAATQRNCEQSESHDSRSAAALMDIPVIVTGIQQLAKGQDRIEQKLDAHVVATREQAKKAS